MKTDSQTKCASCEARYSHVEQGRREYFVFWGPYFLCDLCHRLAIMEALYAESKPPLNLTDSEDLGLVLKYCLANTYPASEKRCPYAKAQLLAGFPKITTSEGDFKEANAMFLCRYPDREMPTHEARLTSELTQCPDPERRKMIDALDV